MRKWWTVERAEEERKTDERVRGSAVMICYYEVKFTKTKSWREIIRDCMVQDFWYI